MPLVATPAVEASAAAGGAALSFQRAGVRPQVMRRLRRGLYPTEDELDLHGLNQTAARDRLADFLARSRDAGRRCVRVIHGKGYRSGARGPILKVAVDLWLRRHMDVMAFTSAKGYRRRHRRSLRSASRLKPSMRQQHRGHRRQAFVAPDESQALRGGRFDVDELRRHL